MHRGILLLLSIFLILSCNDEINSPLVDKATIKVKVIAHNSYAVDSATVILKGTKYQAITNSLGEVVFKDVPPAKYNIVAYVKSVGSGQKLVDVVQGENDISIDFLDGVFFEPTIIVGSHYPFATNDTVRVLCKIVDINTPTESIKVNFIYKNQVIQSGHPDNQGFIQFIAYDFPNGIDTVFVSATNIDSITNKSNIIINKTMPFRVHLKIESSLDGIVKLVWEPSSDLNFSYYKIQRDYGYGYFDYKLISDKNVGFFIDSSTIFTDKISYQVLTKNTDIYDHTFSNIVSVYDPNGESFLITPRFTLIHPTKPYLYLFEDHYSAGNSRILLYNYQTRSVLSEVITAKTIHYPYIGETKRGVELVVPADNGDILLYDAENLNLKKTIPTGLSAWCTALNYDGIIFICSNNGLKSFNGDTGLPIDSTNHIRTYHLYSFSNKDALFGYVGYSLYYANIDKQGHILSYVLGTSPLYLNEYVYSISNSEQYAILSGTGEIYSIDSDLNYIGALPFTLSKKHAIFNDYDNLIYTAISDERRIRGYSFPNLFLDQAFRTKGYPERLFFRENQLIVISKVPNSNYSYGIEKFKIN